MRKTTLVRYTVCGDAYTVLSELHSETSTLYHSTTSPQIAKTKFLTKFRHNKCCRIWLQVEKMFGCYYTDRSINTLRFDSVESDID